VSRLVLLKESALSVRVLVALSVRQA